MDRVPSLLELAAAKVPQPYSGDSVVAGLLQMADERRRQRELPFRRRFQQYVMAEAAGPQSSPMDAVRNILPDIFKRPLG